MRLQSQPAEKQKLAIAVALPLVREVSKQMNRTGVQLRLTSQNARQNALQEKYTTIRVENSKNAYQRHVRPILGAARNIALNGRVALQKGFPEVLRIGVKLGELLRQFKQFLELCTARRDLSVPA